MHGFILMKFKLKSKYDPMKCRRKLDDIDYLGKIIKEFVDHEWFHQMLMKTLSS